MIKKIIIGIILFFACASYIITIFDDGISFLSLFIWTTSFSLFAFALALIDNYYD